MPFNLFCLDSFSIRPTERVSRIRAGGLSWITSAALVALSLISQTLTAQRSLPGEKSVSCAGATGQIVMHAPSQATSTLSLCDGRLLTGGASPFGQAEPLALASADLDGDGVPDLISGFGSGNSGAITIYRGNVNALWPYGTALHNGPPPAFLPNPRTFTMPEQPDFLLTGDFDADGHWDVVAARRGGNALYLMRGDGHGGLRPAKSIPVPGSITAMIAGEINRADGLTDLIVAVNTAGGARALVYESPKGALADTPEVFRLSAPAAALALGKFDGNAMNDLAVASGNQLVVIHARDRKLSLDGSARASVPRAKVTVEELPFSIRALTAGDFTGTGPGVAALDEAGKVHILEHAVSESSLAAKLINNPDFQPTFELSKRGPDGKQVVVGGRMTPNTRAKITALRESVRNSESVSEWTERSTVTLPAGFSQAAPLLVSGRISGSLEEDIIAVDSGNRQVHVLSTGTNSRQTRAAALARRHSAAGNLAVTPMRVIASMEAEAAPAVVLPMRLSRHGLKGLVTLHAGQTGPTVMPQDTPPGNTFTVTNTSDAIIQVGPEITGPAGSLRKALYDASQATGTSSIVFNIPTTDLGYNPATGTFLIQPLSESVPGAFNTFALNPINATVTIDGYTQPGASPNTLINGDNARILIQIDGGKATTPGGSGLVPFDDVGSVYRGLDFTGWTNPAISQSASGSTASGAEGMEASGVQDFIEGNFFGTDPTGKIAAPNRIGVFADNGPGFGSTAGGNIIGGTTPQARNILSGNSNSGVLFLSTAFEAQLQGNFIGLDTTGAAIVSNPREVDRSNSFDGAGLNGATVTIGGTLPGTSNVIAGNGTNVDINDLTEGGQAADSIVQGNLIGTDATGTHAIANQGYGVSILHNPTRMLIGGTTPAARNVISGNLAGVYVFDNSFYNDVQGNYIGVDITGTKAVPNVQQGFTSGSTGSDEIPAGYTTIGGSVAGAGNVISGNTEDGIQISGTSTSQSYPNPQVGNTIQGNFIGTNATGNASIPNGGNGVDLIGGATNNIIGDSAQGSGNLIANNKQNGILIDPGAGTGNNTIANIIQSNGGAGVRINTGTGNRISQNSIFGNGDLGISLQNAGPNLNTPCNSSNTGANNLQNAPSLTVGTGTAFISATATDPNGNTSEFSNAVKASVTGSLLNLLGNFNSTPNTNYTIEFFYSSAADPSGYGEGQTYLTSTTVTTGADCTTAIDNPVDTTKVDLSVSLSSNTTTFDVGPDFGRYVFTGTVTNNGPATAHNVVFVDTLPAGLEISNAYCNMGPCQAPVASSVGNCTVSGNKVTCNMGTMPSGATASVILPVQATAAGSLNDTASVTATGADPDVTNNTALLKQNADYPSPFIDHIDPASAVVITSGSLPLTVYGNGFLPTSAVTFNGTAVTTTGYLDNQVCGGPFEPGFCSAIQISVPASLLNAPGAVTITVTNPDPGPGGGGNEPASISFTLVASCTYSADFFGFNPIEAEGDTLIPEFVEVTANAPTCAWTATSHVPWLVILDNAKSTGSGSLDVSVAPNTGAARSGTLTVAGQTIEIDQEAGDSSICTYALNPASAHLSAAGGSNTFAVTTGSRCSYFVEPYPQESTYQTGVQFITIPQNSSLLVGNGNPSYTVAANHGAPRTGAIMVGGDVFTLTQDAPACYYTLDSTSALIPTTGGTGTIGVTASSPSCSWTAKPSDSSLVSVSSGASGTGNGTVKYIVHANTEGPQMPTITIGDANGYSIYTITQASVYTCTFTITPPSIEVSFNGVSNFFLVNASYNFCKWAAISSDPTSLTIGDVSGQGGLSTNGSASGTGAVYYRVGQNPTGKPRTLTITAGCETFTVNQDGASASAPAPTITALQPSTIAAGSPGFSLVVTGTGFVNGSVVNFSGSAKTTTYQSATQVTATILASDVLTAATVPVTVTNPSSGGISGPANFIITAASGNPMAELSPTSVTFADTTVNTTSTAKTVTLSNTGSVALAITGITIAGANPTDFSQTNNCGSSLAAQSHCTVSVTFHPASAGSFTATLSVADDASGSPQTASLTGKGTTTPTPAVSLTPPSLSFSATSGTTSAAQTVMLKNTGDAALTISGITINGTNPTDFADAAACGSSLAAGASCSISVTFTPASASTFAATLSVADNATGSPHTVALTGTGTAAAAPAVSLTPASLTFAATTGTTSASQTATLKNTGDATLNITGVTLTGSGSSDFDLNNHCGSTLAAGASCSISITFTPASTASFSATLTIADNAPGSPQTISLTGTGTAPPAPAISITPGSLSFSAVAGTTSTAQSLTIKNTGNALLTISAITITGASPADFADTAACSASIATNDSCTISVTFTPASATTFTASLSITDNATGSPHTVSLTGTGTAPPTPTFAITSSTGAQTITAGEVATYSVTATAQNGSFPNAVTLAATGLPPGAIASFSPASVTPGSGSASSQLSVQTAAATTQAALGGRSSFMFAGSMLPLAGLLFVMRKHRRRWLTLAVLLFASLSAIATLSGCGGGFALTRSTAKTYTINITGTSGTIQQSTTVQLTVK